MAKREIPKFLVSRQYISVVISAIVLFSIIFLTIYQPYEIDVWLSTRDTLHFGFTLLYYIAAMVILYISRRLMSVLQERVALTTMTYIWWILAENLTMSGIYTAIAVNVFPVKGVEVQEIALRALMCSTLIVAIPNAVIALYAAYRAKSEELEAMQYELERMGADYRILKDLKDSEIRAAAMALQSAKQTNMPRMVHLYDNNDKLRLTINIDALYYLESEDNYIKVHYKHNDKITSYMLRCRTSSIEKSLEGTTMVRCHRSYIVNISKISYLGEEHRMHYITLNDKSIKYIPVSKTYYHSLIEALNKTLPKA